MDYCAYCSHWEDDHWDADHIGFCEKHKIFQRGTRSACIDWKHESWIEEDD